MVFKKKKIKNFIVNYYENDSEIGKVISNGHLWDYGFKPFYQKYYRPNTNILDIGGFIGTNSLIFSEIIDKKKKIYVFEPQYYDCLIKNIEDNNLKDVIIPYKYGLANVNGFIHSDTVVDTSVRSNYGGKTLITLHDKELDAQLISKDKNTIELKKLDNFEFDDIGLIKIDVEGFELKVLQGAIETIKNNNYPPIFIEIWDAVCWRGTANTKDYYNKNKNDIINFLLDLNYKIIHKSKHDYIFINDNNTITPINPE
jgi:FkbM family methyltransferase